MKQEENKAETVGKKKRVGFIRKLKMKLVAKFKKKDPNIYPAY